MSDWYVVGSGPAGVSAALALVRQGRKVHMLDGGVRLEEDRQAVVRSLQSMEPEQWPQSSVDVLKEGMESGLAGIPLKRLYGSDFPYRDLEKFTALRCSGVDMMFSLAAGGLSNVWGSAVLPFTQRDMAHWPVTLDDLSPYYTKVFDYMHLSARQDGLTAVLPLYSDRFSALKPSRQAEAFMRDMESAGAGLARKGVSFGYSRLAVQAESGEGKPGCAYCGLCLYGCPYDLIYNSVQTLERLLTEPNFTYSPDTLVEWVEETAGAVTIHARHRLTAERLTFDGEKVFIGAGVIPTTKILLHSKDAFDRPVIMKDSQYFLVPLLRARGTKNVDEENLHTLTQICLEIMDPNISPNGIHVAVYTYSDVFEPVLERALGPVGRAFPPLVKAILGRLLLLGGYLHSDDSPSMEIRLLHENNESGCLVTMTAVNNPRSRPAVRKLVRKLMSCAREFRGVPIIPVARMGEPGRAYHAGGTFPMATNPGEFECDALGRPGGMNRVHVIDATCFPSIPATNITLTAMAHAYRVAELSSKG